MKLILYTPLQTLNKAFRKEKVSRDSFTGFKNELKVLINRINEDESEEHLKYPLRDFLKNTFYSDHEINTKGKTDLGIYLDNTDKSKLGVIIETKKPSNVGDMISITDPNKKAMHEAILYYLRERIDENNNEIKNIVITNIYEWFIFDAHTFERLFYKSNLTKEYTKWKAGQKTSFNTPLFYNEIAKPYLDECDKEISATWFDLRDYQKGLNTGDKQAEKKLTALYKIFSGVTLLKETFANDSNSLDKRFYNELLHIIGLEEKKEGSKKTIKRKVIPDHGSLIENTIATLEANEKLYKVDNRERYGETKTDQLFNVALELVITWINRILFLKLLEAQLVKYHQGNKEYRFLDTRFIADFDEINELFFEVLAKQEGERKDYISEKFRFIPYLNSSLFELKHGSLEDNTILISNLKGRFNLPVYSQSVLRNNGKKLTGELPTLKYLFDFLDAYDFTSEGAEDIQEENKTLINASVLGLIFEKINGYKDGSFFTPGFITMYMCRETIRRAILQKFEEIKGWKCESIYQLKDKIENRTEANAIVNSLKICDPAVGSGHFLVSALNEIIAIKSELDILCYRNGNRIRNYMVEIVNDELIITDKESEEIFEYRLNEKDRPVDYLQEMQEALFHEKETLIENCLFGVDINPNSVNICRLRLWIELLKNSYYTKDSGYTTLETLPNIDINIKCGNSLVSRFPLDADLSKALKTIKYNFNTYRKCVVDYKNASNKADKRSLEVLIDQIKNDFRDEIHNNDPKYIRLNKVKGEMISLLDQTRMFELSPEQKKEFDKNVEKFSSEQSRLEQEITEIKNNIIYRNAFEWRFEFPEVLDDDGNFIGFDVVIGNPPYGVKEKGKSYLDIVEKFYPIARRTPDSYFLFMILATQIARSSFFINLIVPNTFCDIEQGDKFREWILNDTDIYRLWDTSWAFESAIVDTVVYFQRKIKQFSKSIELINSNRDIILLPNDEIKHNQGFKIDFRSDYKNKGLFNRIIRSSIPLKNYCSVKAGVKLYEKGKGFPPQDEHIMKTKPYTLIGERPTGWRPLIRGEKIDRYLVKEIHEFVNYGVWLAAPRDEGTFTGERILIRRTDDIIRAAFTNDESICVNSCHVLKIIGNLSVYYLLGILNSRLIQWIFSQQNPQMIGKVFAEIKVIYIENIPIIVPLEKPLSNFAIKVKSILAIKQSNPKGDTGELERQIDQLIYEIYGLSDEEIDIVESSSSKNNIVNPLGKLLVN